MSRDDPPYCGDCGMSHFGRHARAEYCQTCNLLMTFDEDQELTCTNKDCERLGLGRETPARRSASPRKP
jgi:hypothetical protein